MPSNQETISFDWPIILFELLLLQFFDSANETNIYEIKSRILRSSFIFKKNHGFIQEGNPSEKVVIVEEELNGLNIDDIGNLKDSPRFVFIDEEFENLIVVNDGGKVTRNINETRNQAFY